MHFSTNYEISILNQFLCIPKRNPYFLSQYFQSLQFLTISFVSPSHSLHLFTSLHPACTAHLFFASSSSHPHSSCMLFFIVLFPFTSPPSLDLMYHADPPSLSLLGFRRITSGCGSMERLRPRPIAGWSWRNPSRSSWTSLATSHCSSSESCSTCQVFRGWSKKQPGKECSKTTYTVSDTTFCASAFSFSLL